jgi:hypothetical protein
LLWQQIVPEQTMNRFLSLIFGFILSFGHSQTAKAHPTDPFIAPEDRTASLDSDIPVHNHRQVVRKVSYNSYSEDACRPSCLYNASSTNNTSQPHLVLRAQR